MLTVLVTGEFIPFYFPDSLQLKTHGNGAKEKGFIHMHQTDEQKQQLDTLAEQAANTQDIRVLADLGSFLFASIHDHYLTNGQRAEAAGVSRSTLDHAHTQKMTLATAKKIADTMNAKVSDIFYIVKD